MQAIDAATLEIAEAVGTQSAATNDISRTVAQAAAEPAGQVRLPPSPALNPIASSAAFAPGRS